MSLREQVDLNNIPRHIAVIMDGNGRWAKQFGNERTFGHEHGVKSVRETIEGCAELGVKYLTLYAFSTENWNRPKEEIDILMQILVNSIKNEAESLQKNNIRLTSIGAIDQLPDTCRETLMDCMQLTKNNDHMVVNVALSYSGRWDIVNAVKQIVIDAKEGLIRPDDLSEELISSYLSTKNIPDPELMIRTSGEMRISNFLLWQLAYSELYITDVLWPDFTKEQLYAALINYQKRERRFGKISEQVIS